jgi:hypothetical protein
LCALSCGGSRSAAGIRIFWRSASYYEFLQHAFAIIV